MDSVKKKNDITKKTYIQAWKWKQKRSQNKDVSFKSLAEFLKR